MSQAADRRPSLELPDALELMRTARLPIVHVVAGGASRGIANLDDVIARLIRP